MALPIEQLESALVAAVRQIGNAHSTLLNTDDVTIVVTEIDVQVNLIAPQGQGAVMLEQVTITPARTSKTTQKAKSTKGAQVNNSEQANNTTGTKNQSEDSTQTRTYGRQTLGQTTQDG